MLDASIAAARSGALVIEQPDWGTLFVAGPDAQSWLNGLLTCDVKSLTPGAGAWGLALSKQGKIQSELNVVMTDAGLYVSTARGTHAALFENFQNFLIMEDAELDDRTAEFAWLALHGPRALSAARAVSERGAHSAAIDWTGLGGAALVAPRAVVPELLAALRDMDAIRLGTREAWERLRIERGVPEYGTDFGPQDNPHEASLERRAVSWTKGCYLGQEVVCMQDMRGRVKRRLVPVKVDGPAPLAVGTPVDSEAGRAGEITSSCPADEAGGSLALARLSTRALEGGSLIAAGRRLELLNPLTG